MNRYKLEDFKMCDSLFGGDKISIWDMTKFEGSDIMIFLYEDKMKELPSDIKKIIENSANTLLGKSGLKINEVLINSTIHIYVSDDAIYKSLCVGTTMYKIFREEIGSFELDDVGYEYIEIKTDIRVYDTCKQFAKKELNNLLFK